MPSTDRSIPETQIIILAPHTLLRAAWQALVGQQPGLAVLATASSSVEFEGVGEPEGAAILLDVGSGQQTQVENLVKALPGVGILVLVDDYDLAEIGRLLGAGATGFLHRNAPVAELARGLIATGRGEIVLPPELAARALAAMARGNLADPLPEPNLTERELDVVRLLARGLTNKDIAQDLFLSVRTIEAHLRSIFGKLGVANRTEAALWAVNRGLGEI